MKITVVEPSWYYPTPVDASGLMKHVERCGRTCYKSEDRITADSAYKFIRTICKRNHVSVLEHASITVGIIGSRTMSHQLVRHRLAAYCLAGETEVVAFSGKRRSPKRWTMKQLYDWSLDPKRKGRLKLIRLRSCDEHGRLVPGKIKSVIASGSQQVFKITTQFGRTIEATAKHRFLTPQGWKQLGDLQVGDKLLSNGKVAYQNKEWIQKMYIDQNLPRKEIAALAGVSDACLGQWIAKFGLQKPCSQRPNKQPGHGVKGMFSPEAKQKLSAMHMGALNPGWKGNAASAQAGRLRAQREFTLPELCETCGSTDRIVRHHCDGDTHNNSRSNILFLCENCHHQWHTGQAVLSVFKDEIMSIEPAGIKETFDIEMEGPNHNFVANGVVVHNSQESMRYCNYGKLGLQVICPPSTGLGAGTYEKDNRGWFDKPGGSEWTCKQLHWADAVVSAYQAYLVQLEDTKPEDARFLLPNATKTEVMTTYNLRAWQHVLRTRCDPHAQWEIRGIMRSILTDFAQMMPAVFADLDNELPE